ncbi:hypothetical protein M5J07_17750 [Achromobacter mucicolens]|uniref:hypothetical protein n=1 Tax=Achromobacter mucicolens TaxID=1389922 RepID=UPI0020A46A11|nr:hypothetical protein [Achromobacter mucicolens]MCP2516788.1 hypothetical protein [Achromobacter mucicolens]
MEIPFIAAKTGSYLLSVGINSKEAKVPGFHSRRSAKLLRTGTNSEKIAVIEALRCTHAALSIPLGFITPHAASTGAATARPRSSAPHDASRHVDLPFLPTTSSLEIILAP